MSTLVLSCSGSSDDDIVIEPVNVIPSNLAVNVSVVGTDGSNPYGDGSGVVNFTATATNAVKFGFIIDNQSEQQITNGTHQYTFKNIEGVETH